MSDYSRLWDRDCLGILRGSIFRIDYVIDWKMGETYFLRSKLCLKTLKLPKIHISRTAGCMKLIDSSLNDPKTLFTMSVLRYACPLDNEKCPKNATFVSFLCIIIMKLHDCSNSRPYTVDYALEWLQEQIY